MTIFLIADNHFGSKEVIDIFQRKNPETGKLFRNAEEMDALMMKRWNGVVGKDDTVFSIGDFTWAGDWNDTSDVWWKAPETYQHYLDKLNGTKVLLHGNHDPWDMGTMVLNYGGQSFYLTHDPGWSGENIPMNWKGWVIHGHHHWVPDWDNPDRTVYPFIYGVRKNINVACEVVDYTPVKLDWILPLLTGQRVETVSSRLVGAVT